jgi:hypothetical protein
MTILSIPLFGAEDALGAPEDHVGVPVANNAHVYIGPRFVVFLEPVSILPDGFLSGDRILKVVRLPRTLRTIGHNVFSEMESLEGIDLSATAVETMGDWFLFESVSVRTCRLPSTLHSVGSYCLFRTSIKRVDLSQTLVAVLPLGFLSCTPVEELLVPRSLERIDYDALQTTCLRRLDCSHTVLSYIGARALTVSPLVDLILPSTVELIAFSALEDTQLRVVRVGEAEIPWINEHLFDPEVDELRLPSFISTLDPDSLNGTSLRRVDLSLGEIYHIEGNVLCDNPRLEQVLLPSALRTIGGGFLNRAPRLRSLDLRCTKLHTICDDFMFGTPIEEIWRSVGKRFLYGARITCLDLSKTVLTAVGADFLQQCAHLQTLLLPEWLVDIPENLPCPGRMAEAIVLPSTIKYLVAPSFQHAPFLRLMDLKQTVVTILPFGFLSDAPNLINVRLPDSLQMIADDVFMHTSLRSVNLRHTKLCLVGRRFCAFSPLRRLYVPEEFPLERLYSPVHHLT